MYPWAGPAAHGGTSLDLHFTVGPAWVQWVWCERVSPLRPKSPYALRVTSLTSERDRTATSRTAPAVAGRRKVRFTRPSTWPAYWPLLAVVVPYPIWWLLGISNVIWIAMAVPLAYQLLRYRPLRLPRGSAWWALFTTWVLFGAAALWIDAPSGVPGGGADRIPVYVVRLAWLISATIVMLWAYNTPAHEAPDRKVVRIVGWMFVVSTAGGLLGVVASTLELRSVAQIVLPDQLQTTSFVRGVIGIPVASIQDIIGTEAGRPVAPFAFANSWGANLSMFLPFFVVGWCGRNAGWKRWPAMAVVAAAIVPTVVSLNRGLWVSLLLGAAYLFVRTLLRGKVLPALIGAVVLLALAVPLAGGQLGDIVESRLANPHSNERRGGLLESTVGDTVSASPVIGFGSTRDFRGSYASIAGGATPECPGCRVPPLGTQGQLWYVIFATGLIGTVFFLAFYANQVVHHWRSRSSTEAIGVAVLLFLAVQLLVYDTMDIPMMTVMLAIGLMERRHPARHVATTSDWSRWIRASWKVIVVPVVLGAILGAGLSRMSPTVYAATVPIELQPVPSHLAQEGAGDADPTTIDTEASMVFSEQALEEVDRRVGSRPDRDDIQVTAAPTTRVMFITVKDRDRHLAAAMGDALAAAYLDVRSDHLSQRREQVLAELRRQLNAVSGKGEYVEVDFDGNRTRVLLEDVLLDQIEDATTSTTTAGEVLRAAEVAQVRRPVELWATSGAALGLLVGLLVALVRRPRLSMV